MTYTNRLQDDDSLWPYVNTLLRWKKLLIVLPIVAGVATAGALLLIPRKYVAHASFVPAQTAPAISGQLGSIAAQFGIEGLSQLASASGNLSPQFYADLLKSRELLHQTVTTSFTVQGNRPFSGTLIDYIDPDGDTPRERELEAIDEFERKMLAVDADRVTGVVAFTVKTKDPLLSEAISRRMLNLVNEFNLKRRQTQATAERDFVEQRAEEAQQALRAAEAELAQFHASNRGFEMSPFLSTQENRLQRRVALAQQLYTALAQRRESSRLEAVRNTPMVTVIDSPEGLATKAKRFLALKTALAMLGAFAVAVIAAFTIERIRGSRTPDSPGYAEYLSLRAGRRGGVGAA